MCAISDARVKTVKDSLSDRQFGVAKSYVTLAFRKRLGKVATEATG
jgi:hypothetical protein